jgi:xanthine dehydrogenase small subunit
VAEAEEAFTSHPWSDAAVERAQQVIARTLTPLSDHRGSSEYRLAVAQSLVEKFWWEVRA